ncbi:anti-sigma factor [Nocardia brasiliensis]|uniref:anti-sigma factor n=1 Tax=Nocardia brasiliensis TaxID=37326 RepID=UPI0024558194|nr:anti-sigma factor [Nocardia brasiliensis]
MGRRAARENRIPTTWRLRVGCESKVVMGMGEWTSRSSTETTTIGVRIPARLEQLTMLRGLAETVALIADFALDEVTDIRLALDEVATSLILDAVPGSQLDCEFTYDTDQMIVHVASVATSEQVVGQAGFGWHIVRTLTHSIAASQAPFDADVAGYPTVVDFSWVRRASDGG